MKKKSFTAVLTFIFINIFSCICAFAGEVSGSEPGRDYSVLFGKIAWVAIAAGVIFVIYLLIALPKKRDSAYLKGVKYRRSPYNKNKKRIAQEHYYKYKRNRYK